MISKSQIKYIRSLYSKKQREADQCFIAEGFKMAQEIIREKPELITELFCTEDFMNENESSLLSKKIKFTPISEKELSQISQLSSPNQVLVVCRNDTNSTISTNFNDQFSFYLDDIRDPGNLGTIIRICSWFGIKELFCSPNTVELYNPKCIQSTMGAFLRVNVYYRELADLIKEGHIKNVYATEMKGKNLYKEELKSGLIVIGNEANGIGELTKKLSNHSISIPSAEGNTESLNAAIATSIIASEIFRRGL